MLQLTLNYRDSVLAREERAAPGRVVAGDRIPDATDLVWNGRSAARLFDVLRGPRPTVLAIGERWGEALATLRARFPEAQLAIVQVRQSGQLVDAEGQLGCALGITGAPLFVVRPDKYLGLATDRAEAAEVEAYLRCLIG
jgi:hypothetical protein